MYLVVVNNEDFTHKRFALVAVSKMYLYHSGNEKRTKPKKADQDGLKLLHVKICSDSTIRLF